MLPSFINVYHPTVSRQCTTLSCLPVGSMYAIYIWQQGSHQYTPFMLAYIPAPWILWVMTQKVPDQGIPA